MTRPAGQPINPTWAVSSGFTLIEMLCALSILAICIAGIAQLCSDAVRTRTRAGIARDATEFLEQLSVDLTLSASSGGFQPTEWARKAMVKGWRLDIQQSAHPNYPGLDTVSIHLTLPRFNRQIHMVRIVRSITS